jgi:hypothetical protein
MGERLKADEVRSAKASAYYSDLIQKYERAARAIPGCHTHRVIAVAHADVQARVWSSDVVVR